MFFWWKKKKKEVEPEEIEPLVDQNQLNELLKDLRKKKKFTPFEKSMYIAGVMIVLNICENLK